MNRKLIFIRDVDGGIIVARYESSVKVQTDGVIEIYTYKDYYHSLNEALNDVYGTAWIPEEEKK